MFRMWENMWVISFSKWHNTDFFSPIYVNYLPPYLSVSLYGRVGHAVSVVLSIIGEGYNDTHGSVSIAINLDGDITQILLILCYSGDQLTQWMINVLLLS